MVLVEPKIKFGFKKFNKDIKMPIVYIKCEQVKDIMERDCKRVTAFKVEDDKEMQTLIRFKNQQNQKVSIILNYLSLELSQSINGSF
jgi:hypothetical protein